MQSNSSLAASLDSGIGNQIEINLYYQDLRNRIQAIRWDFLRPDYDYTNGWVPVESNNMLRLRGFPGTSIAALADDLRRRVYFITPQWVVQELRDNEGTISLWAEIFLTTPF